MSEVTRILGAIEHGEHHAAEQLLPLVYEELRRLALEKMAHEKPGQTLQATALVHEAYLRLVDTERARHWDSRGHFFVAAAEAMRRILVENARRKRRIKHGGGVRRVELDDDLPVVERARRGCAGRRSCPARTGRSRRANGRAGQAALLRRPDDRASRRRARDFSTNRLSELGLRSGLALSAPGEGRLPSRRLTSSTDVSHFFWQSPCGGVA